MIKKWRILIVVLLLVMSYSIFEVSKFELQIDLVDMVLNPYKRYEEPNRSISLLGADDVDYVKYQLMNLANQNQVSLALSYLDPMQENSAEYYWFLLDDKYLSWDMDLNRSLDLETFNNLEEPITNHASSQYYFDFPLDTYTYKIYPFHLYDKSNLSSSVTIFAESEDRLDDFLAGLEEKGLLYIVNKPFQYQGSFIRTINHIISQNPIAILTFGLFLIAIFTVLYQDRRNLSIKLVNGYSKTKYIIEQIKSLIGLQTLTFFGCFLAFYFLNFSLNFNHFLPMLCYYILAVLVVNLISMVLVAITIYSFTDINQTSYIKGIKAKALTSYLVVISKFLIGLLICLAIIPSILNITHTARLYSSMTRQMDKYSDIYTIDYDGNYGATVMEKSDEIIEALNDFDNIIYQSHFDSGREHSGKLVRVNSNYMKKHPILDENKNPIDPNRMNVVYTKTRNIESVEELRPFPGYLCPSEENCLDIETIIIDEDTELVMYNMDPYANDEEISKDFILVPQNDGFFILQLLFVFEDNEQIDKALNELKDIVDIESVYFTKVTDKWEREIDIYRNMLIQDTIKIINYLILMVLLSLIYYQIKLDKVRKEFSIYWLNGISKFNYFYRDYILQIILSGIMIVLVRQIRYPDTPIVLTLILFLIYISIDSTSLVIFRNRFYSQLQKNIKEQI